MNEGNGTFLFTESEDVRDVVGKLVFGANRLRPVSDVVGLPDMQIRCVVPQSDGAFVVFGHISAHDEPWRIIRARTYDGIHYEQAKTVFEEGRAPWLYSTDIVYNPKEACFLCLKWARGDHGHALWGYGSQDGERWERISDKPLYRDHDAFSVVWNNELERYVAYQITYQKWEKRYEDNLGTGTRRVLHIRTSENGVDWEPDDDVSLGGTLMPRQALITPDEEDPDEMEFYLFQAFAHAGRYAGMMLNYAPSPQVVNPNAPWNKHGPHLSPEWWVSKDGENWERPFRETFALDDTSGSVSGGRTASWSGLPCDTPNLISHEPIPIYGRHLWVVGNVVYGVPEDRLFFVGSMANAEFSTTPFVMTDKPLTLHAAFSFHDSEVRAFRGQSYIMVAVLDETGAAVKGFEKERCILRDGEGQPTRLCWEDHDAASLCGKIITLRFYLRDARIYSVRTG